ncbi:rhodanese-like domain-containing protein [Hansschlegelia quercus]|uniref:Rhodanese-like domain-containing protein n=1 Tax=Hansschlegelia quercus TaxID=2528245 RepID=A0A4Q9GGZ2_9HYPH|nr:rhodanese-like domain-containing protein [Hansschlegelia quercus]TBN48249.1 rhodanese-like domain-containing protein [Hansschlegelia quercus]
MSSSMSAYAGDVTPQDAWATLEGDEASALVDVRTVAEWTFVGVPELGDVGKRALLKEWQSYPSGQVDAAFVDKVGSELSAAGLSKDAPVFFLCRSGARSQAAAAAMAAAGWSRCFNVVGGFEGPPNAERHRGSTAGWKADGLPWSQS